MTVQPQEKWKGLAQHYGRHLLVVFVAVLLVHNVFGAHGFLAMHQKQKEIEKVNTEIERLNKENAALEGDVKDLKTDPQTIEKIAREELGQARPGEVIIKLPRPMRAGRRRSRNRRTDFGVKDNAETLRAQRRGRGIPLYATRRAKQRREERIGSLRSE